MAETNRVEFTEEDIQNIRDALDRFEAQKDRAGLVRDELRELASQIEDLAESFDVGVQDIEEGMLLINQGLDQLSQYV